MPETASPLNGSNKLLHTYVGGVRSSLKTTKAKFEAESDGSKSSAIKATRLPRKGYRCHSRFWHPWRPQATRRHVILDHNEQLGAGDASNKRSWSSNGGMLGSATPVQFAHPKVPTQVVAPFTSLTMYDIPWYSCSLLVLRF